MDPQLHIIFIGLLVGVLVGLSGLGGGVLLLPLLILGAGVSPLVAVGSGAVFSALTKIGGSVLHYRRGNVDVKLGLAMALGSIPSVLAGVGLLAFLKDQYGESLNQILSTVIGVLLMLIPAIMILQQRLWEGDRRPLREQLPRWINRYHGAVITGIAGGFLVGVTSVGSGSVIMIMLLLFYRLPPTILVGTDLFHAVILTGVAGLSHFWLGTVDIRLVLWLILGSVPGVLLGTKLTGVISATWLRRVLLVLMFATGIFLI